MEHAGELRDSRRTWTFYMDDALIDHFAPQIGVAALGVYTLLARHAKNHRAFPAWTRIQERLGIGRATVGRALTALEKAGLIRIERRNSPRGDKATSVYILLDLSHFRVSRPTPELPAQLDETEEIQEIALSLRGSVSDHALPVDETSINEEKHHSPPDSMRGSVADHRWFRSGLPGSVADYPLRSEGISEKESQRRKEEDPPLSPKGEERQPAAPKYSHGFEVFWTTYPHKVAKGAAWKVWQRHKLDPLLGVIVPDLLARLLDFDEWRDGYICHPTTYLNGRMWEDGWQSAPRPPKASRNNGKAPPLSKEEAYKKKCRVLIEAATLAGEPINPKWEEAVQ